MPGIVYAEKGVEIEFTKPQYESMLNERCFYDYFYDLDNQDGKIKQFFKKVIKRTGKIMKPIDNIKEIYIEFCAGTWINDAVKGAIKISKRLKSNVILKYNSVELDIEFPAASVKKIIQTYYDKLTTNEHE